MRSKKFNRYFSKDYIFYIFMSIIVIFTSWTIFYRLPVPNIFKLLLLFFIVYRVHNYKISTFNRNIIPSLLLLFIVLSNYFLKFNEDPPFLQMVYSIISIFLLLSLFLLNSKDITRIFDIVYDIFVAIVGLGFVVHILNISGIIHLSPFTVFSTEERDFAVFYTQSYNIENGIINYYRYSSIFDEPGYLGTIGALLLIIKDFDLKNAKNLILLISCFFTLSLSFYLLTAIYFLFKIVLLRKKKYFFILGLCVMIFFLSVAFFPSFSILFERLSIDNSSIGLTDSRVNISSFQKYIDYLQNIDRNILLFGGGHNMSSATVNISLGHVSWVDFIVRNGIVFSLMFSFSFLILIIKKKNNNFTLFVLIFVLSINHRPQVIHLMYFFLIVSALKYNRLLSFNYIDKIRNVDKK